MSADLAPAIDPANPYGIRDGVATRWITKDGRNLLISEMGDQHLQNALRFIERRLHEAQGIVEDFAHHFVGGFGGEDLGAPSSLDDIFEPIFAQEAAAEPVIKGLRAELKRRGLPELVP